MNIIVNVTGKVNTAFAIDTLPSVGDELETIWKHIDKITTIFCKVEKIVRKYHNGTEVEVIVYAKYLRHGE